MVNFSFLDIGHTKELLLCIITSKIKTKCSKIGHVENKYNEFTNVYISHFWALIQISDLYLKRNINAVSNCFLNHKLWDCRMSATLPYQSEIASLHANANNSIYLIGLGYSCYKLYDNKLVDFMEIASYLCVHLKV